MLADKVRSDEEPLTCSQCTATAELVVFCNKCDGYLCEQCVIAHEKMTIFKDHKSCLVPIDQAGSVLPVMKKEYKCFKHDGKLLQVYCEDCGIVICHDCVYDHRGHLFKPAVEAASVIKKKLEANLDSIDTQLKAFRGHSETLQQFESHVMTHPDEVKKLIAEDFDQLIAELDKRKKSLLTEVDTKYDFFSKTLWAEKNTIEGAVDRILAGVKLTKELIKSDDNLEVAVLGTQVSMTLKELNDISWNPETITGLVPVVYIRKDNIKPTSQSNSQFINSIGRLVDLKSLELQLKFMKYSYESPASFYLSSQKAYRFKQFASAQVQVDNKIIKDTDIVISADVTCKSKKFKETGIKELIPYKSSGCNIIFETPVPGDYTVAVTNIGGLSCTLSISLRFISC
jgi:uncharacterized membrane-anchored protein YhcB (DUF1043 family)